MADETIAPSLASGLVQSLRKTSWLIDTKPASQPSAKVAPCERSGKSSFVAEAERTQGEEATAAMDVGY